MSALKAAAVVIGLVLLLLVIAMNVAYIRWLRS